MQLQLSSKTRRMRIAGLGVIVAEQIFAEDANKRFRYHSSRGGGSVWNVVAHLARNRMPAEAFGVYAPDLAGNEAREELESFGVNVGGLSAQADRSTRIFTQWLPLAVPPGPGLAQQNFSFECPVCSRARPGREVAAFTMAPEDLFSDREAPAVFCFDRLTREVCETAREIRSRGILTVIDIGGTSGYDSGDIPQLMQWLENFNLVNLPVDVIEWFAGDARRQFLAHLLASGTDLVSITKGAEGFELCFNGTGNRFRRWKSPAPRVSAVVDATGAGDVHLSALIALLIELGADSWAPCKIMLHETHREHLLGSLRGAALETISGIGARAALPAQNENAAWSGTLRQYRNRALADLKGAYSQARPCIFCCY